MRNPSVLLTVASTVALLLAGCSSDRVEIVQAGSSTVLPIAEAFADEFGSQIGASIIVSGGGSGAGIDEFCRGELDIADASRPIKDEEVSDCEANGIEPFEILVAVDGLSVVVDKSNTFVDCLTIEQLNKIWTADGSKQVDNWNELNADWPNQEIRLYGPGTDSGTYDYWIETVIAPFDGDEATTRSDFTPSEDDNFIVQGVASNDYALGYFGLSYAQENTDKIKILEIDGGEGCVFPDEANIVDGSYSPLSRPLFMYTDGKPEGVLLEYFELALSDEGQGLVAEAGYVPLSTAVREEMVNKIA